MNWKVSDHWSSHASGGKWSTAKRELCHDSPFWPPGRRKVDMRFEKEKKWGARVLCRKMQCGVQPCALKHNPAIDLTLFHTATSLWNGRSKQHLFLSSMEFSNMDQMVWRLNSSWMGSWFEHAHSDWHQARTESELVQDATCFKAKFAHIDTPNWAGVNDRHKGSNITLFACANLCQRIWNLMCWTADFCYVSRLQADTCTSFGTICALLVSSKNLIFWVSMPCVIFFHEFHSLGNLEWKWCHLWKLTPLNSSHCLKPSCHLSLLMVAILNDILHCVCLSAKHWCILKLIFFYSKHCSS